MLRTRALSKANKHQTAVSIVVVVVAAIVAAPPATTTTATTAPGAAAAAVGSAFSSHAMNNKSVHGKYRNIVLIKNQYNKFNTTVRY